MLTADYDRLGLRPGDRLLDLGCGFGRHAFEALRFDPINPVIYRRAVNETTIARSTLPGRVMLNTTTAGGGGQWWAVGMQ